MVIFNGDYMVIIWKNYLEKLSGDYLGTIRVMMGKQPILKGKSSGNCFVRSFPRKIWWVFRISTQADYGTRT
jgi:hypothetical protein